jgi:hypothetical protein
MNLSALLPVWSAYDVQIALGSRKIPHPAYGRVQDDKVK